MSDEQRNVKESASSTDKPQAQSPSGEGQIPSELEKRVRENLRAEYDRKLTEQQERFQEQLEERLAELQSKSNPTAKQREEIDDIEEQMNALRKKPEAQPWLKSAERIAREIYEERRWQEEVDDQKEFLQETAEEMGVDYKALIKDLAVYEGKYANLRPMKRAQKCLKDYKKFKDMEKREAELKKREMEASGSTEDGTRTLREESRVKNIHEAKNDADYMDVLSNVFDSKK